MSINIAISIVSFLASAALCLFVFLANRKEKINQIFALFILTGVFGIFGDFFFGTPLIHYLTPLFWYKVANVVAIFSPVFYIHFISLFIKKPLRKPVLFTHYMLGIFFQGTLLANFHFFKSLTLSQTHQLIIERDIFYNLFMFYLVSAAIWGVIQVFLQLKKSTGQTKEQLKYFIFGTILIVLAAIIYVVMILTGKHIRIDNLLLTGYTGVIAYSFTKKHLLNVTVIIPKTLSIVITSLLYVGTYCFLIMYYHNHISNKIDLLFLSLSCIYFIISGLTFETLKIKLITTSQKLFLKGYYSTDEILHSISEKLPEALDLPAVLTLIANECFDKMELQNVHILVPNSNSEFSIQSRLSDKEENDIILKSHPLPVFFQNHDIPTSFLELPQLIKDSLKLFHFDNAALILPVHSKNELLGIFIFSPKLNGDSFSESDLFLLSAITNQIVALFEGIRKLEQHAGKLTHYNSYLQSKISSQESEIREKKKIDQDIKLAQSIQSRILPQSTPKIQNYHFETASIAAQKLSGDYFSILPFSNGTIGVLLADAVGKGIQAAVMTANFKRIEEALITEDDNPKEVIAKLNIAIYQNPLYDSLTIFYGVLNPITNTFVYCNGGSEFGLHFSQSKFKDLNAGGPPLGMTLDTTFDEENIQLKDNDILLIFSDGLTEAKNSKSEFFGLKRVQNALQSYHEKAIGRASLTAYLVNKWNEFRNPNDIDSDDLSLIAIEFQKVKIIEKRQTS